MANPIGPNPSWASVYSGQLFRNTLVRQRWLILGGGAAYAIACLWISLRVGAPLLFAQTTLALLVLTLAVYGLTYAKNARLSLLEVNPALMSAVVSAHMTLGAAAVPQGGGARLAALLTLVGLWALIASPTRRATLAALIAVIAVVAGSLFVYLPANGPVQFSRGEALSYWLPALAATIAAAFFLERERRTAFDLRQELERRATSDNLTGVSNRAHINLLAQNEFARARRYREPFSCLMIEIDAYEGIIAQWGDVAANVVVQVFSGYCVVVMRHCDSFGRLGPSRFLALLPETHGPGAHTLAGRMCRDLSNLEVMVGGSPVKFTVSIGATELHATDRWAGDLLRRVEQGLDDAIERGRNQAIFATPPAPPPNLVDDDFDTSEGPGEGSGLFPSP